MAARGSGAAGTGSWERYQVSTNGTCSPSATLKVATECRSSPWTCTGVVRHKASGPPTAQVRPSILRTQGTMDP